MAFVVFYFVLFTRRDLMCCDPPRESAQVEIIKKEGKKEMRSQVASLCT